jgi:hypothetical protein
LTAGQFALILGEEGEGRGFFIQDRLRRGYGYRYGRHFPDAILNILLLIGCFGAYLANQYIFKASGAEFFHSYFNDVLAGLIVLAWSNLIAFPAPKMARWIGSLQGAIIIVGGASFVWEVVAPNLLGRSRFDPLDVLAYFAGAALYVGIASLARNRSRTR